MQKKVTLTFLILLTLSLGWSQNGITPFLQKQGTAIQLIVNEKPFLMLGGELGNSTASSLQDMEKICPLLQTVQGKGKTNGILLSNSIRKQTVTRGDYVFTFKHYYSLPWENTANRCGPN